ncbi:MAG TPA: glutamate-1-semialdehyde 2,1-aminomutase [Thermoanaerobaculia bacterium]|nr:glutamate-1-semialdehyde 2,1-aminomutase [Thermoanaerobaculia bacterium]
MEPRRSGPRPTERSRALFEAAKDLMPGGVSSPVRAFQAVGGDPPVIERGEGAWLIDVDGNRYVDYVLSYGPLILGHAHPSVVGAVSAAARRGTSFGAPNPLEIELARVIRETMPHVEKLRFVNSGTEATMSVLRLARAFTGRPRILKFQGNYHGHADHLLVQAGSGVATLGLPDSPGVPPQVTVNTMVAPYNDKAALHRIFGEFREDIAAVIVEPVAGNMGLVEPVAGFLQELRSLCDKYKVLLVFDEVMTGFRVHPRGAVALYGVVPDLVALGKVIGGGLPVGAYGGRADIMSRVAPEGPVYQAGTLSGNPVAMAAGLATIFELQEAGVWEGLEMRGEQLVRGLAEAARAAGVPLQVSRVGSMFGFFFSEQPVRDYRDAKASNVDRFSTFFHAMLDAGVYLAPSPFEAAFLSTAHGEDEIAFTLEAARRAFAEVAEKGGG